MTEREELLTVEQAAEWLQVNKQTVYNWINRASFHPCMLVDAV